MQDDIRVPARLVFRHVFTATFDAPIPTCAARLPNVHFHSQPQCSPLSIPLLSVPVPGSAFGLDDDALAGEKPSFLDLLFVDVLSNGPFISSDLMRWVPLAVLPLILCLQLSLALYSIPGCLLQRHVFPYLGSFEVVLLT